MSKQRNDGLSRRQFLTTATFAGAGALLGSPFESLAAEPPPETTKIRLIHRTDALCVAPQYMAEELKTLGVRREELARGCWRVMADGDSLCRESR